MATQKSGDFKTQLIWMVVYLPLFTRVSKTRISEPSTEVPGCAVLNVLTGTFCWWYKCTCFFENKLGVGPHGSEHKDCFF